MKKLILLFLAGLLLSTSALANSFTIGTGYGKEKINDNLSIDLFQVQGLYRFDNGFTRGGAVMKGFPSANTVADEERYELIVGYTTRIKKFSPYGFVSKGLRDYKQSSKASVDYYTIKIGTTFDLSNKWYTDTNLRYRDSKDISWETNTYTFGLGYKITETISVGIFKGWQDGDYDSDITSISFKKRF